MHNSLCRRAGLLGALACLPQLAFQVFRELRSLQKEKEALQPCCVMAHDTECGYQIPLLPYRDDTALCVAFTGSQSPADVMR